MLKLLHPLVLRPRVRTKLGDFSILGLASVPKPLRLKHWFYKHFLLLVVFFFFGRGKKSDIIPLLTGVCPVGSRGNSDVVQLLNGLCKGNFFIISVLGASAFANVLVGGLTPFFFFLFFSGLGLAGGNSARRFLVGSDVVQQ